MISGILIDAFRAQHLALRPALELSIGTQPDSAYTLIEADQLLSAKVYDYVIVDPTTESLAVCLNFLLEQKEKNNIRPFCAILIASAENSPRFVTSCADLEPDDIIVKPLKVSELVTRLQSTLDKKNPLKIAFLEYERHGRLADAYKIIERSAKNAATPAQHKQLLKAQAYFCTRQKNHKLAMNSLQKLRSIADIPSTHVLIAQNLLASGQVQKSIELLDHVLSSNPQLLAGYDTLAEAQYTQGDGELALRARQKANELNPLNAQRSKKLSQEAFDLGNFELAQKTLEFQIKNLLIAEAMDNPQAMLAQVLFAQNKSDEGQRLLVDSQAKNKMESPQILLAQVAADLSKKDYPAAHILLKILQTKDEEKPGPKSYLSQAALFAYESEAHDIADLWLERVLLRQSLSFSQYQKIKDGMAKLGLGEHLSLLSRRAAHTRAKLKERAKQLQEAGMFMDIAQDMIEYTEHPDASIEELIDTLAAMAQADRNGQLHQAARVVVEKIQGRILSLEPNPNQRNAMDRALAEITSI